jgi:hypothetical protein
MPEVIVVDSYLEVYKMIEELTGDDSSLTSVNIISYYQQQN